MTALACGEHSLTEREADGGKGGGAGRGGSGRSWEVGWGQGGRVGGMVGVRKVFQERRLRPPWVLVDGGRLGAQEGAGRPRQRV